MKRLTIFERLPVIYLVIFLCCEALTSNFASGAPQENILNKWKNAVINLECLVDYGIFTDWMKKDLQFEQKIRRALKVKQLQGIITADKYNRALQDTYELYDVFVQDLRSRGTAVFMKQDERLYLITARHVLEHEETERVYQSIFFPHRIDTMLSGSKIPIPRLQTWAVGPTKQQAYSFHPKVDLAIISLNTNATILFGKALSDILLSLGRSPISMQEVLDEPSSEVAEIFTVGFLDATSIVGKKKPFPSPHWDTEAVSEPTFSFGRIAMFHPKLEYFWCDVSIYPGSSGGPVIENGKLVGIVSAQPSIPGTGRIPFAKVIKAKYIKDLLDAQVKKDRLHK
jgi:hypothetical protein